MNNFLGLHHGSLLVEDTQRALEFYVGVIGMQTVERPNLSFPGAWLKVGNEQIHLLELPDPAVIEDMPEHGGRDRHLAMSISDMEYLQQQLNQANIPFTVSRSGRRALFCRDPDGNALEFIEAQQTFSQ